MQVFMFDKTIFGIDILEALKPTSEHDRKHVLQLLQLYGDQALRFCCFSIFFRNKLQTQLLIGSKCSNTELRLRNVSNPKA